MKSGFETIESNELEMVAGGAGGATGAAGAGLGNSSSGGNNDQLLSTVQGIQSSLKDLSSNQNQGPFSGPNGGLMLGMMAMAMRRQNTTVVYNGGRGSYYWRASW
jgi:hypothetical protein